MDEDKVTQDPSANPNASASPNPPPRRRGVLRVLRVFKVVFFLAALASLGGLVVMLLWNAVVPAAFGGPELGWLQALGLLVLARVLVGGWGRGRGGFGHRGHGRWRARWEEKMAQMSPEERARMREMFAGSCGWGRAHDASAKPGA